MADLLDVPGHASWLGSRNGIDGGCGRLVTFHPNAATVSTD